LYDLVSKTYLDKNGEYNFSSYNGLIVRFQNSEEFIFGTMIEDINFTKPIALPDITDNNGSGSVPGGGGNSSVKPPSTGGEGIRPIPQTTPTFESAGLTSNDD